MKEATAGGHLVRHGGVPSDDDPVAPVLELPAVAAQGATEVVRVSEHLDVDVHLRCLTTAPRALHDVDEVATEGERQGPGRWAPGPSGVSLIPWLGASPPGTPRQDGPPRDCPCRSHIRTGEHPPAGIPWLAGKA